MITKNKNDIIILISIFSVGLLMRGPITEVSPILMDLINVFNLSVYEVGILTSIPLFSLSIFSPLSALLASQKGVLVAMYTGVVLIAIGILIKLIGTVEALFLGTLTVTAGIATSNVMLPSVVKMYFPNHTAVVTSLYILFFSIGGALCSMTAMPIMQLFNQIQMPGWKYALGSTLVLVLIPIFLWLPKIKSESSTIDTCSEDIKLHSVLYSSTAWCLTLFFALTAFVNYAFITWLPRLLTSFNVNQMMAGYQHGFLQLSGALSSIILVPLLSRNYKVRHMLMISISFVLLSAFGFLNWHEFYPVWVFFAGFGTSSVFILALSLINLKASTVKQVYGLSTMVQFFGYIIAALSLNELSILINSISGEDEFLICLMTITPIWLVLGIFVTKPTVVKYQRNVVIQVEI